MKKIIILQSILMLVNSASMATTPEQILANGQDTSIRKGIETRKGTIKALIENVIQLNAQLKNENPNQDVYSLIKDLKDSLPAQNALEISDIFPAEDWFYDEGKPGSFMVGVLYLQQFPHKITKDLKEKLTKVSKTAHPLLKQEIEKLI